jgi:hypothetical protein
MTKPIDLKVLVKESLTDPMGLNKPTLPSTAMVSGNAIGDKGNWTGVYGHSERSIAIYGDSPVFAGFFQGDVYINGQLTLGPGDGHSVNELIQTVSQLVQTMNRLERRIAACEQNIGKTGVTRRGEAVHTPPTRPTIEVTDITSASSDGFVHFDVKGTDIGHNLRRSVVLSVSNEDTGSELVVSGQVPNPTISTSTIFAQSDFSFFTQVFVQAKSGDRLIVSANDGRSDANDMTGTLWTTPVKFQVSS